MGTSLELGDNSVSYLIISLLFGITNGLDFMVLYFLLTAIALLHFSVQQEQDKELVWNLKACV